MKPTKEVISHKTAKDWMESAQRVVVVNRGFVRCPHFPDVTVLPVELADSGPNVECVEVQLHSVENSVMEIGTCTCGTLYMRKIL